MRSVCKLYVVVRASPIHGQQGGHSSLRLSDLLLVDWCCRLRSALRLLLLLLLALTFCRC